MRCGEGTIVEVQGGVWRVCVCVRECYVSVCCMVVCALCCMARDLDTDPLARTHEPPLCVRVVMRGRETPTPHPTLLVLLTVGEIFVFDDRL